MLDRRPQKWDAVQQGSDNAWETQATSVQTWPASRVDVGHDTQNLTFHGFSRNPVPASEGGDYADPGDSPRSSSTDTTCGPLGCLLGFHGAGNLQAPIISRATLVGARFVFLDGDEIILRDLDIRGRAARNGGISGGYRHPPLGISPKLVIATGLAAAASCCLRRLTWCGCFVAWCGVCLAALQPG